MNPKEPEKTTKDIVVISESYFVHEEHRGFYNKTRDDVRRTACHAVQEIMLKTKRNFTKLPPQQQQQQQQQQQHVQCQSHSKRHYRTSNLQSTTEIF